MTEFIKESTINLIFFILEIKRKGLKNLKKSKNEI